MPDFTHYPPKHEVRAQRIAADFRPNEDYEHLQKLRDSNDPRWQQVSDVSRIALGLYESDRATHDAINGGTA